MHHLHLGAGALGLGLVCPASTQAGVPCHIVNRRSDTFERRRFFIASNGGYSLAQFEEDARFIPICSALHYADAACDEIAAIDDNLLITTALKQEGLLDSIPTILRLIRARPSTVQTVVVAAENQVDTIYLEERLQLSGLKPRAEIHFVKAVVDRICNKPALLATGLEVVTESFGKLYIPKTGEGSAVLIEAFGTGLWEAVDDIDFVVKRKKWLVNAAHLLMTFAAHRLGATSVRSLVLETTSGRELLRGLLSELQEITAYACTSGRSHLKRIRAELAPFTDELEGRLSSFPQRLFDGVTRFSQPNDLHRFFIDYHRKVTEPAVAYLAEGFAAPYFESLLNAWVIESIAKSKWIIDG